MINVFRFSSVNFFFFYHINKPRRTKVLNVTQLFTYYSSYRLLYTIYKIRLSYRLSTLKLRYNHNMFHVVWVKCFWHSVWYPYFFLVVNYYFFRILYNRIVHVVSTLYHYQHEQRSKEGRYVYYTLYIFTDVKLYVFTSVYMYKKKNYSYFYDAHYTFT